MTVIHGKKRGLPTPGPCSAFGLRAARPLYLSLRSLREGMRHACETLQSGRDKADKPCSGGALLRADLLDELVDLGLELLDGNAALRDEGAQCSEGGFGEEVDKAE